MNDLTLYPTDPPTHNWLRAIAIITLGSLGLAGMFAATLIEEGDAFIPMWHGSISVDCAGKVTVESQPPGAVFIGTVTGVGTATVTASGVLDWPPPNDEMPAVSASKGGCTVATTPAPTTTTTEEPPSTTVPPSTSTVSPSTTTPVTTAPTSSVPPPSVMPTTTSVASSTTSPTVPTAETPPTTAPAGGGQPTTTTSPRPQTTQPEPYCSRFPNAEGCVEGLPTAETG